MKKRGIRYHVVRKSKLSLLLFSKIILVLISFFVVIAALSIVSPWANLYQLSLSSIIIWGIGLAIVIILYLIMIIRVLKILKFS